MTKTFTTDRGMTVTVSIPDRTPEEQLVRDKEIEQSVIAIYRKMEREGKLIAAWKKGI